MSRGLAYWNDETIAFIRENFIAVSVPTWTRHAEGPEGEFLRLAGIDKQWITSSGYMTCVSASGQLLGRKPTPKVLEAFAALPESERAPGAVEVPFLQPDDAVIPSPPEGGLVLRVHARFLAEDESGKLRRASGGDFPLMADDPDLQRRWRLFLEPNTEFMWLTRAEKEAMIPDQPTRGMRLEIDPAVGVRMARFHLTPKRATTSEGGIVHPKNVRDTDLALIVENVTDSKISMRLAGELSWGTEFDAAQATSPNGPLDMGFATQLLGRVEIDRETGEFTRFDIVAPGRVWGRWGDANRKSMAIERPGAAPFGFALELAENDSPTDRIPPGGNGRYVAERGYFNPAN